MKRISIKATIGMAAILLLTAACTDELNDRQGDTEYAIAFTPATETRAAVESGELPENSSFNVWGWYGTENNITNQVFANNHETVTKNGDSWGYTGGTQYWIKGMTYNFYGVYPANLGECSKDGIITVNEFDCSATGKDAVDLMTATNTRKLSNPVKDEETSAVNMQFQHLLSKVNIVATVEGGNATVNAITFNGMAIKGTYNSKEGWAETTTGNFTNNEPKVLNTTGVDLLGDMLLIPQTVTEDFKLTISYTLDGEEQLNKEILLPTNITQWDAGQSYKYTLTFKGNNIIFTVNVASWGHSTGGIITVE